MQILGASAALGGLAACQPPREKIVPFVHAPPEDRPGKRFHYATALALDGYATGLLVASSDGRPVKVEGNPAHPTSQGAVVHLGSGSAPRPLRPGSALAGYWRGGTALSWRGLLAEIQKLASGARGRRRRAPRLPRSRRTPRPRRPTCAAGSRRASRRPASTCGRRSPTRTPPRGPASPSAVRSSLHASLEQARTILSLDADFLSGQGESLRLTREFAAPPGARAPR